MSSPYLSIIIPVYHGEKTIEQLFSRINKFCRERLYSFEVIFVWDCGPDQSWSVISELKQSYPQVIKAVHLSRNFGQHNALICGFEQALGELIITMDEDLQHQPEDIQKLIETYNLTNADVVYGAYSRESHAKYRNFTSDILKSIIKISIPNLHPDYSSFRLIKQSVAKASTLMQNSYTFLDGYLSWITSNVTSCKVVHQQRLAGSSSYTFRKLVRHSINIFATFSDFPIQIVTWLSFLFFLFAIGYSLVVLFQKLIFQALVPGFASIIILISLGFGAVLFSLGVIGQYVHQINTKTTKRPNYHILRKIG